MPEAACGSPLRMLSPKAPDHPPFKLVLENREVIKEWLLHHFGSLSFNILETHQLLVIEFSSPLKLLVDEIGLPFVVHKAALLQIHGMEEEKADLKPHEALWLLEGAGRHIQ